MGWFSFSSGFPGKGMHFCPETLCWDCFLVGLVRFLLGFMAFFVVVFSCFYFDCLFLRIF